MSFIGNTNKSVNCIYGTFNIVEGKEVPMLFAVKFPQYVTKVKDPEPNPEPVFVPEVVVETNEYIERQLQEEKTNERKGKKQ